MSQAAWQGVGVIAGSLAFIAAAARFLVRNEQTTVRNLRDLIDELHEEIERVNSAREADRIRCDVKLERLEAEILALKLNQRGQ